MVVCVSEGRRVAWLRSRGHVELPARRLKEDAPVVVGVQRRRLLV